MTKDFIKLLSDVVILLLGFLTTFTMLARGSYSAREVLWLMIDLFCPLRPPVCPTNQDRSSSGKLTASQCRLELIVSIQV